MPIKIVCKDIVNSDIIVTGKAWSLSQICQMIPLCVHGWKPLSEACPSAHVHPARLLDDQIAQPGGVSAFKSTAVSSCSSGDVIELIIYKCIPNEEMSLKTYFWEMRELWVKKILYLSIFISCAVKHWWERDFIDSVLSGTQQYMFGICLHMPTGRPGVVWFMGSQRVRHDWATELNWTELIDPFNSFHWSLSLHYAQIYSLYHNIKFDIWLIFSVFT